MNRDLYEFGPYVLDAGQLLLRKDGSLVALPPKALGILLALVKERGELVTKQQLMQAVWPDTFVEEGNLTQNVFVLRRILGKAPDGSDYIQTLPKRGYRIAVTVRGLEPVATFTGRSPGSVLTSAKEEWPAAAAKTPWRRAISLASSALLAVAAIGALTPSPSPRILRSTQLTYGSDPSYSVVTDGPRLYFRQDRTGKQQIAQVTVADGEVSPLPVPISHPVIADISPGHSQLLISSSDATDAPLWTMPLPGGSPHRVGAIEANGASWAPDGEHILFTKGDSIYLASPDGGGVKKIVSLAEGIAQCAGFSPDGSRIRFGVIDRQVHAPTLWEVRSDGGHLHRLLPGWPAALECGGNWTPDGRYFVFGSDTGDGGHDIYSMRESPDLLSRSPGPPKRLTFGPLKFEAPVVSLDGKKLFVYGWHERGELVHYDPSSGHFVPFLGGISVAGVSFSPDRQWVAYTVVPGYDLWRSRVDGSDRMQLIPPVANTRLCMPRWSPDGKQIAVMSEVSGGSWEILLVPAGGGPPKAMIEQNNPQADPAWSADGSRIAFATGGVIGKDQSEVQIFDIRTRQVSTLPGSGGMFSPRWSPDGRYLATLSFELHPGKILRFDFRDRAWVEWVADEDVGYPSWTADGQYLEYEQSGAGEARVRRVKVGNSHPEDLFGLKGLRRFDGMAGPWSDNAPDGSRMFVRDTSGRDIYALDVDFP